MVRFVPYMVRQLVNYCPGNNWYARIGWFGRSGAEPSCLGGLVRRRLFALLGTRVRVLAPPSRNFPEKSSKSEKIIENPSSEPSDPPSVPFIVRLVPFIVRSYHLLYDPYHLLYDPYHLLYAVRRAVCSFPSEARAGSFVSARSFVFVCLCLCWGLEPRS